VNNEEFITTQRQLLLMASLVREMDLDGFLERIGTAYALGPMLDPTLYKRGVDNLEIVRRIAEAARKFKATAEEVCGEAKKQRWNAT